MIYKNIFVALMILPLFSCRQENHNDELSYERIANTKPRNVVFILSDDHRYDYMGFMNKIPWLETPNLDKLAASGAHFENAFVTTSLCSPSRASILTGQFSHVHQVVDNMALEPDGLTYFPQYLQKEGYQTAFVGKWHMGSQEDHPRPGFDKWVSFKGQGEYYNPTISIDGRQKKYTDSAYITEILTDLALEWLTERDKEKPFFLYLSHKAIHSEFDAAKQDRGRYHGKPIPNPETHDLTEAEIVDEMKIMHRQKSTRSKEAGGKDWKNPPVDGVNYDGIPQWVINQRESWHGVDYAYHRPGYLDTVIWRYTETLYSMDREIGRVLDYLEEEGLAGSTMVIYMGDNGFLFGEHGLIDKRQMYEESIKVPLLVRCPDLVEANIKVPQMVQNIDIGPTVLELAGIKTPSQMNGRSFTPLLKGEAPDDWRERIYYEYYWEHDFPQTPTMHGVRTNRYKLIRYHGVWDTNEFYDLQNDPYEKNNLIESPEHQKLIRQLTGDIYDWLQSTDGMQIPLKKTVKYRFGDHINRGM